MTKLRFAAVLFILLAVGSGPSFAQGRAPARRAVLDAALNGTGQPDEILRVIVKHRPGAAARVKGKVRSRVDAIKREHRSIGALSVALRRAKLHTVCGDPDVLRCSVDAVVRVTAQETSTMSSTPTTEAATDATASPSTYDGQNLRATLGIEPSNLGKNVGIAVIDSGIAPVQDLVHNIWAFYDFTAGGVATTPSDAYGHGTHVAGLIAGSGELSKGKYIGVATGARLIGLKVLDAEGKGYTSDVIAAIEFAIANRESLGIHVINLSLGHPIFEHPTADPLVQAVEKASAAGIVVVASAGNWGYNRTTGQIGYAGIASPGNAPSAITAGALRTKATADRGDDEVALFSARGPAWYEAGVKPDIVAPGQALIAINDPSSTLYQNPERHTDITPYLRLSGTSMAAAVTSGVVALMIEANWLDEWHSPPPLTPNTVKALLQFSALPVPQTFLLDGIPRPLVEGAGGINAAGAMALARAIDPAVEAGQVWLDAQYEPYSTIAGVTHTWAQQVVWGDHVVWGDSVMWHQKAWTRRIVWGNHVVWKNHSVTTDGLTHSGHLPRESFDVWSANVIWGDELVSGNGENIVWGDIGGDGRTWKDGVSWGDDGVSWGDHDGVSWGDSVLDGTED